MSGSKIKVISYFILSVISSPVLLLYIHGHIYFHPLFIIIFFLLSTIYYLLSIHISSVFNLSYPNTLFFMPIVVVNIHVLPSTYSLYSLNLYQTSVSYFFITLLHSDYRITNSLNYLNYN